MLIGLIAKFLVITNPQKAKSCAYMAGTRRVISLTARRKILIKTLIPNLTILTLAETLKGRPQRFLIAVITTCTVLRSARSDVYWVIYTFVWLPAALREAQTCRYLVYSEANFQVFRPAGATRCTDGGEIWHGGGDRRSPPPCQISPP